MMKDVNHHYCTERPGAAPDRPCPDLRIAMRQLYGSKRFDFGSVGYNFYDENNKELAENCYHLARTIAGKIFFPAHKMNGNTINQARGYHNQINDMLYFTLQSIKKYYDGERGDCPIKGVIERYGYFFDRFTSFEEYIEYNLLQNCRLLPKKFPTGENELIGYWVSSIDFFNTRLLGIEEYAKQNNLSDL